MMADIIYGAFVQVLEKLAEVGIRRWSGVPWLTDADAASRKLSYFENLASFAAHGSVE
jgi:hypothetical protein